MSFLPEHIDSRMTNRASNPPYPGPLPSMKSADSVNAYIEQRFELSPSDRGKYLAGDTS